MRRFVTIFLLSALVYSAWSKPLQVAIKHTVIIDTDGAIDDLRAMAILLSHSEITLKAVLLSDGTLTPEESYEKVRALLHEYGLDSIPVAQGDILPGVNPPWRKFNEGILWGRPYNPGTVRLNAASCLTGMLEHSKDPVILVCLGPLTNLARAFQDKAFQAGKIEKIIWYNESVNPPAGFNYECDKGALDLVTKTKIRMDVISNLHKNEVVLDTTFLTFCKQYKNKLAITLSAVHSQPEVYSKLQEMHFRLCDELVSIYLTNPELFDMNPLKNTKIRFDSDYNAFSVKEALQDMISCRYSISANVVFNKFPDQRELFTYDVRQIMDSAIIRYGAEEWKANVMTDEFHGHLGVFSIVGAKMGIRAREWFGVGPDMLEVKSYAGVKPPYSCLNDGIQVSTGATLGMGTITLSSDSITQPVAIFACKGRSIKISLRKEFLSQVDADITEGIVKFGLMDDGYWKLIRRNAIKYWITWDRNKIFEIEELK